MAPAVAAPSNKRMRLSIIIPTLNEAGAIEAVLKQLAIQRSSGCEIIVVDGGSLDETMTIAAPLADKVISTPRGRGRQMNAGAEAASGEILWFLHADSTIPSNATEAIEHAVANGSVWGHFDIRLSGKQPMLRIVERLMNLRSCISGIATGDQGIFVTRNAFLVANGFPEIPLMEDVALSKVLRRRSHPCCLRQKLVTSSRYWEKNGIFRTILLMWRLRLAYALGANPGKLAKLYYR